MALVDIDPFTFATCFTSEDVEADSFSNPFTMLTAQPTIEPSRSEPDDMDGEACSEEETRPSPQTTTEEEVSPAVVDQEEMVVEVSGDDDGASTKDETSTQDDMIIEEVAQETTTTSTNQFNGYGGLRNLGNTCYMNSALQMIASLDHFVEELERESPPNSPETEEAKSVRQAFLELMETLRGGEAVSPDDFKRALDERTSLFLGFRQEDSHEFLTTLLDILDEDYKVKPEPVEDDKQQPMETEPVDEVKVEAQVLEEIGTNSTTTKPEESNNIHQEVETASDCTEMQDPVRSEEEDGETAPAETAESNPCPNGTTTKLSTCQSFSDLQPDGIEELIYARLLDSNYNFDTAVVPATPPRCKLVGGRMTSPDLHDAVVLRKEGESVASVSTEEAQSPTPSPAESAEPSPVESYFKTEVSVRLTCESCKFTRSHVENFLHLSLEIGGDSSSVADGLRKFFAPEKREIKCEKCFCESAMQTMEITRLPRALLLHFKRFIVDVSDDYTSITYRKNQSDFQFDDNLSLDEDMGGVLADCCSQDVIVPNLLSQQQQSSPDCRRGTYHIRSVVNHIGSSAACGHYTADALRAYPDKGERQWTRFNDSYVSTVSANEAIKNSSKTAYLTMYELS